MINTVHMRQRKEEEDHPKLKLMSQEARRRPKLNRPRTPLRCIENIHARMRMLGVPPGVGSSVAGVRQRIPLWVKQPLGK